jgi:hypothetical protein
LDAAGAKRCRSTVRVAKRVRHAEGFAGQDGDDIHEAAAQLSNAAPCRYAGLQAGREYAVDVVSRSIRARRSKIWSAFTTEAIETDLLPAVARATAGDLCRGEERKACASVAAALFHNIRAGMPGRDGSVSEHHAVSMQNAGAAPLATRKLRQ